MSESSKPVHTMSPTERLAEGIRRVMALHAHFQGQGARVRLESTTLIVETSVGVYFIDVADDEPRSITMQRIESLESGDASHVALACAAATDRSYGAKAILRSVDGGYRLHFVVETFAVELSSFTSAVGFYQAAIEDCRSEFIRLIADN